LIGVHQRYSAANTGLADPLNADRLTAKLGLGFRDEAANGSRAGRLGRACYLSAMFR